jgi:hypothetical protein
MEADKRRDAALTVGLLTALWIIAVPALAILGAVQSFSLMGGGPENERLAGALILVAGAAAVLIPFAATIIAYRADRKVMGGIYLVLLILVLFPAGAMIAGGAGALARGPHSADLPAPTPGPPGRCVPLSGSDNTCPGG